MFTPRHNFLFPGQVDAADASGRTGLHWAAERGDAGLCSLLLAKGADPHARDGLRRLALDWAVRWALDKG